MSFPRHFVGRRLGFSSHTHCRLQKERRSRFPPSHFTLPIAPSSCRIFAVDFSMSNSHRGAVYGGSGPLRSREGISARAAANSDEIQLRIDPMHADLDEEIVGLRTKLSQLKSVAQEIGSEAKFQNDFISQLQMTLIKAQAGVKNNMRRLNKSIIQQGSNHVMHVVLFALLCFFAVYFWSKVSRR